MLVDGDDVLAAKLIWPGAPNPGSTVKAQLTSKPSGSRRGIARLEDGTEIQLDRIGREHTEGAAIWVEITRAPVAERGRLKRALGRVRDTRAVEETLERGGQLNTDGFCYPLPFAEDFRQLPRGETLDGRWDEVWQTANGGQIEFDGGSVLVSTTPAMTLIDVDGHLSPRELSLAAIPAIRRALLWFDIGGNIGIDFPTIEAKKERKAVDEALGAALDDWPHERTAMNGFGFVQLIARLEGPSLLHRFATSRTGMCARYALRVAERAEGTGPVLLLRIHPALKAKLKPEWLDELRRRTGREVRIETEGGLALEAPQAQILSE